MSDSQAKWSADGRDLPPIEPHTKAKHQVLESYIESLIITLYGRARYGETTFTIIDGFCGGGMYDDKDNKTLWEGSPIRIIKAVREGYTKSERIYPLNVKYIFIDKKRSHLDCLKTYSMPKAGLGELVDEQQHEFQGKSGKLVEECQFQKGEFEDLVDCCVFTVDIRKGHSLFILDPFGWSDVSTISIRKINSLKGSEILYTYMINYIKRTELGKPGKDRTTLNTVLEADGYYDSVNFKELDKRGQQLYLRNQSLALFRDRGKAHYAYTFSVISKGHATVLYYLMHFSQNLTALQVMKETLWKYNNLDYLFHFEVYGLGFKTVEYYESTPELDFDIRGTNDSHQECALKLDRQLRDLIFTNEDGLSFRQICEITMQENPASKEHYISYIKRLREDKEIEVIRKGEKVKGQKIELQNKDIIRITGVKQISLFPSF